MRCCAKDEGLMALRSRPAGGGFKPPHAALAEDRRGERCGKGVVEASGGDQEDERKRFAEDVSLQKLKWHRNRGTAYCPGMSLAGDPRTGQMVSGMEAT
jgi:hypothetical protein